MSQFSPDADAGGPESPEAKPTRSAASSPLIRALAVTGGAVLLAAGAWVVLTGGGGEELLDPSLSVAADPFVVTAPATPAPSDAATTSAPSVYPATGRDPFLPLFGAPAADSGSGVVDPGAGEDTAYPTAAPTPTPTPALTPAPTGKKKPVPTTGPTL